ncbi:hypothetical protein J2S01_002388 [Pectinatus haikarae]|uniref:Uncharacterized protein n=1 Tax=Pectinatus haikarae TaxID=349096 RepID=A0ABT9YAA7_9FIRM|nr:hypothetical protein [Pectinatus haikarae]
MNRKYKYVKGLLYLGINMMLIGIIAFLKTFRLIWIESA